MDGGRGNEGGGWAIDGSMGGGVDMSGNMLSSEGCWLLVNFILLAQLNFSSKDASPSAPPSRRSPGSGMCIWI
uniref:Uncharacterized protein n=1 Tax=Ditylenchus dipsaci TaxID=166011 RepID=A0A915DEI6_9BILA